MSMRRAAIAAFFAGLLVYPVSFLLTVNALHQVVEEQKPSSSLWLPGRALAMATVALFAFSVVAAFFVTDRAGRIWWAVPATVLTIGVTYFDLIGFGFRL